MVLENTKNTFGEEVGQVVFNEKCFQKALQNFEEKATTTSIETAVLYLEIRIYRLLDNASELFIQGSYPESIVLLRAAYESVLTAEFLRTRERDAERWLSGNKYQQWYIRKKLGVTNEVYKQLSESFAHPNVESIHWYIERSGGKITFKLGRHFNRMGFQICYTLYSLMVLYSLIVLNWTFPAFLSKDEEYAKCFEYLKNKIPDEAKEILKV